MKKLLVITAALALFAAPAFAIVSGGSHDLTDNSVSNKGEICVFCHTPHGAQSAAFGDVPLWNIDSATANTSAVTGDSEMCMACHDGTVMFTDVVKPGRGALDAGGYTYATFGNLSGDALGMTNDHPVNISYAAAEAAKTGEFIAAASITNGAKLSTGGTVECFSCHDVHDETNAPYLRGTMAASALCLGCHIK